MAEKTLANFAEEWYKEQGKIVPDKNSKEYDEMYQSWVEFAFADFADCEE